MKGNLRIFIIYFLLLFPTLVFAQVRGGGVPSGVPVSSGSGSSSWTTSGNDQYSANSGNVGVGSSNPLGKLEVRETQSFDLVYNFNGVATYTNNTTESKTTFGTAFNVLADDTQFLYVGKSTTFKDISIGLKTNLTAANTLDVEYWNGSAWTTLTVTDSTNALLNSGSLTFAIPGSWATTSVNSQTNYWIRLSLITTPTTVPSVYLIRPGSNETLRIFSSISDTTPTFQVSANGNILSNGVSVSTPATIVVGLATSRGGHRADYICTGAKDQVCLNAAIDALPSTGGRIIVLEGQYNITGSVEVDKDNLEIYGMGIDKTIIKPSLSIDSAILQDLTPTSGAPRLNLVVRDMTLDGSNMTKSAATSRKGIMVTYMTRPHIENVYFKETGSTALGIDYLLGGVITHNRFVDCGYSLATTGNSSIGIGTGGYSDEPTIITENYATGGGLANILIETQGGLVGESKNVIISNNILEAGNQYNVLLRGSVQLTLTGNIINGSLGDNVQIEDYSSVVPRRLLINDNIITASAGYGIDITSTDATEIIMAGNNMCRNSSGTVRSLMAPAELRRFNNACDTVNFIDGNVGIGTAIPSATLDVNGMIKGVSFGNIGIGTTNTAQSPLTVMSGNVGIGTWNPQNLFCVGGTCQTSLTSTGGTFGGTTISASSLSLASGSASVVANSSAGGASLTLRGGTNATSSIELKSTGGTGTGDFVKITGGTNGGTEIARFIGAGNVGIGTTLPSATAEVKGTFTVRGAQTSPWTVKTTANTACNTTCGTSMCAFGEDTGVIGTLLACTDATADVCICMGP